MMVAGVIDALENRGKTRKGELTCLANGTLAVNGLMGSRRFMMGSGKRNAATPAASSAEDSMMINALLIYALCVVPLSLVLISSFLRAGRGDHLND